MVFKEIQPNALSESFYSDDEICWLRCQCESENYVRKDDEFVKVEKHTVPTSLTTVENQSEESLVNFAI